MEPITATHTLFASPGGQRLHREEEVPEDWEAQGYTVFVLPGHMISPRAQLMYGLELVGDEVHIGHELDTAYLETEADQGDIPG